MKCLPLAVLAAVAPCFPVCSATAQDPVQGFATELSLRRSAGEVLATGPGYRARIDAFGVEFVPVASATGSLTLELQSITRAGGGVWEPEAMAEGPVEDGSRVQLDRGAGIVEHFDATASGIEHSFVFATRPAGSGDLVVRLRATTRLPLVHADPAAGLRFGADGVGITIGGVTGIGANGERARGEIRGADGFVEYVLPAAFVDAASYPLVLDPLVGPAFQVAAAASDAQAKIAFDASTLTYLVVWRETNASATGVLWGQRLSVAGAPIGSAIVITNSQPIDRPFDVVNVNATDRFLVAYVVSYTHPVFGYSSKDVMCKSVRASTGAVSSGVVVEGVDLTFLQGIDGLDVAAGGDSRTGVFGIGEYALVAYQYADSAGTRRARFRRVHVPASGDPVVGGYTTLVTVPAAGMGGLAVSRHAGSAGRWLCSWGEGSGGPTFPVRLARIIDAAGNPCVAVAVTNGSSRDGSVATADGTSFALAWTDVATSRLRVRTLTWSGSCNAAPNLGPAFDPIQASGSCSKPALDFAQNRYVLAWQQRPPLSFLTSVRVKSLDPATCVACSAEHAAETSVNSQGDAAICARWSGATNQNDNALVTWTDNGVVRARLYDAVFGGSQANLGGQCGGSGGANVHGYSGTPTLGDATFAFTLSSPSAPVLALIVGFTQFGFGCGPCTLVPSMDVVLPGVSPYALAIPCDPGLIGTQLFSQWLLFEPGGCAILPDFALSNAMRFTIGD
jgi:hypothetical protein